MEAEFMSDALDDLAADQAEQADPFARTSAAYAELLQADAAIDAITVNDGFTAFDAACDKVVAAVQALREAIADDTNACNDRALILRLHEMTIRRLARQLTGVRS